MAQTQPHSAAAGTRLVEDGEQYDVIIMGAGVTGLYALYRLRERGFAVRVFEAGGGVGGTWYWNRYPGARFDSESYTYGYSFSEELLQEWDWKEHYSGQPETERYLNYVADKFDLRRDIRFHARVASAVFDKGEDRWQVHLEDGNRVGVIGTGATGVQLITEIAKDVGHLTVFQRTANYCAPLRNGPIDPETQRQIKASYPDIFKQCSETAGSFIHQFDPRSAMAVSPEERLEQYERLWAEPGFKKWLANFYDIMLPGPANEDYAAFVRQKIRERVKDPVVADKLVPKDHLFGSKRLPCESGYYAVTGALNRIDIRGEGGQTLKDKFAAGPRTYMGLQSVGFPNLFTINAASVGNFVRAAEPLVDWVRDCIGYVRDHRYTRIVPAPEAEAAWTQHVVEAGAKILRTQADSWFVGANIPGKARFLLTSPDTAPVMRAKRAEVAAKGYEGFLLQ